MAENFDAEFEDALRFLASRMPSVDKLVKPTLLHSVRVGMTLYSSGHDKNVCIAGLLHDLVDDAEVSEEELNSKFGSEITKLVLVNTKNLDIQDEQEKTRELVERCATHNEDAAVIKAVDITDNLTYFKKLDEPQKMEKLIMMGKLLLEKIPSIYSDKVFTQLAEELKSL